MPLNWPALQPTHTEADPPLYDPAKQFWQATVVFELNCPAVHCVHDKARNAL